jgi:diaminopropionate ammonia-lyase
VIGVEPVTAACVMASLSAGRPVAVETPGTSMAGLDCARPSAVAWPDLRDGLSATMTVSDHEVVQAMRELADRGHAIGESGAAAAAALRVLVSDPGLRELLGLGLGLRTLVVATEGPTDPDSYHRATGR